MKSQDGSRCEEISLTDKFSFPHHRLLEKGQLNEVTKHFGLIESLHNDTEFSDSS